MTIAAGMTATVGTATFGLMLLQSQFRCAIPRSGVTPAPSFRSQAALSNVEGGPRPHKRITIGPTRLRYFEDDNVLQLSLEMTSRYDIVYVPTDRRWPERMPEWARHRRDDIMAEIKRLAAGHPIRWVDDDT